MNLHEMDKLHTSMVRQMEEAEMMDQAEVGGISQRKTSVSAACQTDKVTDGAKKFYISMFDNNVTGVTESVTRLQVCF